MKTNLKLIAAMLVLLLAVGAFAACGGTPATTVAPTTAPTTAAPTTVAPTTGETAERGEIPATYTKVKMYDGTYGFGDASVTAAMNDDESKFYLTWLAFDEEQVLEGTVENGICKVSFDKSGFMAGDCQLIYDDAIKSTEPWLTLG